MAFLGMAVGILIGHYADHVSMWVFALTAGLFMYVALVDMWPTVLLVLDGFSLYDLGTDRPMGLCLIWFRCPGEMAWASWTGEDRLVNGK
ncbi:hypothetical protein NHX12_017346 [Muraenolepis orangiensis]|uniref:Zinc transporter ZIP6 n=1 Tax=Muraenolepis orangiensis TaxID=630683 RepID=A0A9Q0D955_9TELE|nr:hypothetical protein NHX12_017346 [Muraenolepis orangiensis]